MKQAEKSDFRRLIGARILSEANDLKRTQEALAAETGMPLDDIRSVIAGEAGVEKIRQVIDRMVSCYPISHADLWIEPDDSDDGVVLMRAGQSKATARVFQRPDRSGVLSDYYEYRDTAMSRLGPFKPEWIQPLRIVENDAGDNPDVAFNKGHLMHQMTFFIGEVNFYWEQDGVRHCSTMNTGDSNYITPFVPHSFTSRNAAAPGLIIAVTFSGAARRAAAEFARIGAAVDSLVADPRDAAMAIGAKIGRQLRAESMSPAQLSRRLAAAGLETQRIAGLLAGRLLPTDQELRLVADALAVRPADLAVTALAAADEVVLRFRGESVSRPWPDDNAPRCLLTELARTSHMHSLRGFEVEVVDTDESGARADFEHGLFEYIYNYGTEPVVMLWGASRSAVLEPGDSACVRPMVPHRFARQAGQSGAGRLAVVRVGGLLDDVALDEYGRFAREGRNRLARETMRWF